MESLSLYCFKPDFFALKIRIVVSVICSFLFLCVVSLYQNLFIHSPIEKLGYFQFGSMRNGAIVSIVI